MRISADFLKFLKMCVIRVHLRKSSVNGFPMTAISRDFGSSS